MEANETRLVVRQNISYKWLWLLESVDRHVVNRSDGVFSTRSACVTDAELKGFAVS